MHADCAARGDRCVDTMLLLPRDGIDDYFLVNDGHWNARGNAVVAEALADAWGEG